MSDSNVIIRFATYDDVDKIMKAINDHWDANHLLAHNKDFFMYFLGDLNNRLNMVIGEELNTGEIVGFLGFVRYNSNEHPDIALVLWKAVEGKASLLGIKLLFFLIGNLKHKLISTVGTNPKTALPIYKNLKYHVGKLDHYYRISDKDEYKIAKIMNKRILSVSDSDWKVDRLYNFNKFKTMIDYSILNEMHPHKDVDYFNHRFFMHPINNYIVYSIVKKDIHAAPAFFVCREVEKVGMKILRIIDYIGKELYFSYIASSLQRIMDKNNYEYIDCYCHGMSEEIMNKAGFVLRQEDDPNIIPNYFEPFLVKNVDIYYFSNKCENFRAFKGDGDQDQPRLNRACPQSNLCGQALI